MFWVIVNGVQPTACNFIKKATLVKVFTSGFCKNIQKIFFAEHCWVDAAWKDTPYLSVFSPNVGKYETEKSQKKRKVLNEPFIRCRNTMRWLHFQKQLSEVFYKKGVLKIFTNFAGKHLCQSLFFNNVASLRLQLSSDIS